MHFRLDFGFKIQKLEPDSDLTALLLIFQIFQMKIKSLTGTTFIVLEAALDPVVNEAGAFLNSPPPPRHRRLTIVTDETEIKQVTCTLALV